MPAIPATPGATPAGMLAAQPARVRVGWPLIGAFVAALGAPGPVAAESLPRSVTRSVTWFDEVPQPMRPVTGSLQWKPPAMGTGRLGGTTAWRSFRSWRPYRARTEPTAYDGVIREVARRHDLEYALVKAVIQAESDFDHRAVSPKGACGLMQLMPATAAEMGVRQVFVPRDNIDGGCRYLRLMLDRYGSMTLALAAYNAGPDRVDRAGGVPAIEETREYLSRVLQYRLGYLGQQ